MNIRVYKKENLYFALKVIFTVIIFLAIIGNFSKLQDAESSIIGVIVVYGLMIWLFIAFQKLFLIGFLKGNGIEVNNVQFPEVFAAYKEMVEKLGIKNHLSSTQAVVCYRTVAYQGIPYLNAALLPMCAFDRRRVDSVRQKGR